MFPYPAGVKEIEVETMGIEKRRREGGKQRMM
jgi:hypothetical protein